MISLYEVNPESWKVKWGVPGAGWGEWGVIAWWVQGLVWGEERVLEVDSVQHVISASECCN